MFLFWKFSYTTKQQMNETTSTWLITTTCGIFANCPVPYFNSAWFNISNSAIGSSDVASTRFKMTWQRSTCRMNAWPSPTPWAAPVYAIRPGMSFKFEKNKKLDDQVQRGYFYSHTISKKIDLHKVLVLHFLHHSFYIHHLGCYQPEEGPIQ